MAQGALSGLLSFHGTLLCDILGYQDASLIDDDVIKNNEPLTRIAFMSDHKKPALNPTATLIFAFIVSHPECTETVIRHHLQVKKTSTFSALKKLREQGLVARRGRATQYRYYALDTQGRIWQATLGERTRHILGFIILHGPIHMNSIRQAFELAPRMLRYSLVRLLNMKLIVEDEQQPYGGTYLALEQEAPYGIVIPEPPRKLNAIPKTPIIKRPDFSYQELNDLIAKAQECEERGFYRRAMNAWGKVQAYAMSSDIVNMAFQRRRQCLLDYQSRCR